MERWEDTEEGKDVTESEKTQNKFQLGLCLGLHKFQIPEFLSR